MGQSFYVYNNGDLRRKDNTLQFTSAEGEKKDIPIERIDDIYVMSEMTFNTTLFSVTYRSMAYRFIFSIIIISIREVFIRRKSYWPDSCS